MHIWQLILQELRTCIVVLQNFLSSYFYSYKLNCAYPACCILLLLKCNYTVEN